MPEQPYFPPVATAPSAFPPVGDVVTHHEPVERDGSGDCWIVEFDYRSDNGPVRIGPFPSRAEGQRWLECGREFDFEASVVPVAEP